MCPRAQNNQKHQSTRMTHNKRATSQLGAHAAAPALKPGSSRCAETRSGGKTSAATASAHATTTSNQKTRKALLNYCHLAAAILLLVIASSTLPAGSVKPIQQQQQHHAVPATPVYSSTSATVVPSEPDAPQSPLPVQTVRTDPLRDPQQQQQVVSQKSPLNGRQFGDTINDISIECNSHNIVVTLQTNQGFNGMIYPKGLSKNSTCMMEYHQLAANITYYLPLKSCNTMSTDVEDGVEYFNTVMVQPHRRLVTNQGRGYHIRCRYQTKERTITNQDQQLSVNLTQSTPSVMGSATMPACTMRIYSASDLSHEVSAENVRIGDELHLIIGLDDQDVYGMLVTNCLVRDGMNWGEQPLIDDQGCPVDEEIMPEFTYAANLTRASVTFQAHKFPYTSSVYYQCNVRLCFRDSAGCAHVPPNCSPNRIATGGPAATAAYDRGAAYKAATNTHNELLAPAASGGGSHKQRSSTRTRRWVDAGELEAVALPGEAPAGAVALPLVMGRDLSIEVSSGLHVDESELEPGSSGSGSSAADKDPLMMASTNDDPSSGLSGGAPEASEEPDATSVGAKQEPSEKQEREQRQRNERDFCLSLRKFAIIVSLISLLLMLAIICLIAWLIQRRNRQKLDERMHSTYDHHHQQQQQQQNYTNQHHSNRAYCRD